MSVHFGRLRKKQRQCENQYNIFHFFVIIVIPRGTCTPAPSIHSFIFIRRITYHAPLAYLPSLHLICPPPPPFQILFSLLLGITDVPGEIENNAYAKF